MSMTQHRTDHTQWPREAESAAEDLHSMLPARPVTGRKVAVGAKKHFSSAIVYGPGAGCVLDVESLTEKRVALVLLARENVARLESEAELKTASENRGRRNPQDDDDIAWISSRSEN